MSASSKQQPLEMAPCGLAPDQSLICVHRPLSGARAATGIRGWRLVLVVGCGRTGVLQEMGDKPCGLCQLWECRFMFL